MGDKAYSSAASRRRRSDIAVTYTVDTLDGPRHTFHGLPHMHRHIRPERLTELLDDLPSSVRSWSPFASPPRATA
jgi:hypothetical protein